MAAIEKVKVVVLGDSESKEVLHKFPNPDKDKERFNTWVYSVGGAILGLSNDHIFKYRRVCRGHFEEKFWCRNNLLSNIAIPTKNMPGVGKTSLTYLIAHNKPLLSPGWTVGCSVEVKLHRYKEGTQAQNTFFVELWDVGGSNGHRNTRNVFYQPTHGIILVHDLTNRKSQINLQKWLSEILNQDNPTLQHVDVDPEQFLGSTQIPILVIGTKFDLAEEKQKKNQYRRLASSIAEQCGSDEIFVNCHQARSLAPGASNSVKLTRFFDKVIERRYYSRISPFPDKRRQIPSYMMATSTPLSNNKPAQYLSPRFYHMD